MNPRRARRRQRSRRHRLQARIRTAFELAVRDWIPDIAKIYPGQARRRINFGWCEQVAEGVKEYLDGMGVTALVIRDDNAVAASDHEIYGDDEWTHAWIWCEGLHYDAKCLDGVRHWLGMPHFKAWTECPEDPAIITPVLTPARETQTLFMTAALSKAMMKTIRAEQRKREA